MTELRCAAVGTSAGGRTYGVNCDPPVGLDGLQVVWVDRDDGEGLVVTVESAPSSAGCPAWSRRVRWDAHRADEQFARQLGTSWRTRWRSIAGLLVAMAAVEFRFTVSPRSGWMSSMHRRFQNSYHEDDAAQS